MANYDNIKLIRVDERLIHGQVVTQWLNKSEANKIIIVDQFLSTNDFLSTGVLKIFRKKKDKDKVIMN